MEVPQEVLEDLQTIRQDFELRWNPTAVLNRAGSFDAEGNPKAQPIYEPRFELWDRDPQGRHYMVMRVQEPDGSFRFPDQRMVDHLKMVNPERYGGNVAAMVKALVDDPTALRELGTQKDTDDLIEAVANWAEWCETPKSGSGISFRGKRILSG